MGCQGEDGGLRGRGLPPLHHHPVEAAGEPHGTHDGLEQEVHDPAREGAEVNPAQSRSAPSPLARARLARGDGRWDRSRELSVTQGAVEAAPICARREGRKRCCTFVPPVGRANRYFVRKAGVPVALSQPREDTRALSAEADLLGREAVNPSPH